jgi:ATP-binding cassette subfamily C exporter for protease/lipase
MSIPFFERSQLTRTLYSFRREFFWIGIFSLIANVLMLTPTLYMLQLYDRVFKSRSEATLFDLTLIMVLFFGAMAFAEWLRSRLLVRSGVRLDQALNFLVFDASYDRALKRAGQKPAEAFGDLATIRQFLTGNGIFAFFDAPWTPVYIAVIFLLDPLLGWLSILFAVIQFVVAWFSHRATVDDIEFSVETAGVSNRFMLGKLRNIEPVHSMGMLGNLRNRWIGYHEEALAANGAAFHKQHRQQAISKFVRYSMQSLTLGAGALLVIDGRLAVGGMIAANILMSKALQPIDLAVGIWKPLIQAIDAFKRLEKLLADYPGRPGQDFNGVLLGEVSLKGLSATVDGRETPILDGLDASFPAGSVVAVVGPSGSGKSTLARCLVGAWPEVQGAVHYDGQPFENFNREHLGAHIGYLPQDIELFDGTIAENIARLGNVDSAKVIEAAQRTGIHEMILRFPKGYDTEIGEAGGMLSGGQRQRLGLARAIYGNPTVVVLDEPNANLDESGERSLMQAVLDLKSQGKTVFLITHRQNILGAADQILALDNGRIAHLVSREAVTAAKNTPTALKAAPALSIQQRQ